MAANFISSGFWNLIALKHAVRFKKYFSYKLLGLYLKALVWYILKYPLLTGLISLAKSQHDDRLVVQSLQMPE